MLYFNFQEKDSFEPEKLRQQQITDIQGYAELAKKGKVTFKEYKTKEETNKEDGESDETAQRAPQGNIYFFHPDHLGTATYLTDINGNPYQFFLNLPFGETMAEQHSFSENYTNPYKFNGKELDTETGLYYYGARYYDPRISVWLSVDPLMEKYPNWNPYNYVMQNPINLIDPTGMSPEGDPPKKNIFIVLDYKPNTTTGKDVKRDTIQFKGWEEQGWHGIYASNLEDANKQLGSYLGDNKADNVVLETHGGVITSNGVPTGDTFMSPDNNIDNNYLSNGDLSNSLNGTNNRNQADVNALIDIVNSINDNGMLLLGSCNTAKNDEFLGNLQCLTGSRINMIGSSDKCTQGYLTFPSNPGVGIYQPLSKSSGASRFNTNFISKTDYHSGMKLYPTGYQGTIQSPEILKNVQINKNGIIPIR